MTSEVFDPLADAADGSAEVIDEEEGIVIEFEDEDGEKFYFEQEMVLEVNGENYALLVEIEDDEQEHKHEHDEGCDCCDEECNVRFAKLVKNADGEDEYIEPTDEEFEAVVEAYNALWDDEDDAPEEGAGA